MTGVARRNLLLLLGGGALFAASWGLGLFDLLRDPEHAHTVLGASWLGESVFAVLVSLLSAVGVPPIVFLIPAPLVFPPHAVFAIGMFVGVFGSYLGFLLARTVGRDYVAKRIPKRVRSWNERLAKNGLVAVILMRLFLYLIPPVSWFLGLSNVRTSHFLVGTAIGIVPGTWLCDYVGGTIFDWLGGQPPWVWALVLVLLGAIVMLPRILQAMDDEPDDT